MNPNNAKVPMYSPRVSIVIPAYNAERFIGAAIESALAQTYRNCELIVVDDGSTDATAAVVRKFGRRVTYLYQPNSRQAAARNRGIAASRGDLLAFLDSDDEWMPTKLEMQVSRFRDDPTLGLVYCLVVRVDSTGRISHFQSSGREGLVLAEILLGNLEFGGGSTMMVPRSVLDDIGGFDTTLSPCEDTDLFWRIAARYPVGCVQEHMVRYRMHSANSHRRVDLTTPAWITLYEKALSNPTVRRLGPWYRRRCLGRLYKMLAGDHLRVGDRRHAAVYACRSVAAWPPTVLSLLTAARRRVRVKRD